MAQATDQQEGSQTAPKLVSFGMVLDELGTLLSEAGTRLTERERAALKDAQDFLSMFPRDFYSPVPYTSYESGEETGNPEPPRYVYAVTSPPKRWP